MIGLIELAELLERTAKALREVSVAVVLPVAMPLDSLPGYFQLSARLRKNLRRDCSHFDRQLAAILTVEDLRKCTADDLLARRGFGQTTLRELRSWTGQNNILLLGE